MVVISAKSIVNSESQMVMEDNESCGSRVVESSAAKSRHQQKKVEVYNEVLRRLKDSDHPEAQEPAFDDQLWAHFNRLPARLPLLFIKDFNLHSYTLDVVVFLFRK